jgi:hypothetical protein
LELDIVEWRDSQVVVVIEGRRHAMLLASDAASAPGSAKVLVRPDWAEFGGDLDASVSARWYRGPHTDYRLATQVGDLELRQLGPPAASVGDAVRWRLKRGWAL